MPNLKTPTLAEIRECLAAHEFDHSMDGAELHAAVAAIFRETDGEPEILFIKRAEKESDPWSGQMAFPGGHIDPTDASPRQAAIRETLEEIGLDLIHHGRQVGALDSEIPTYRGPRKTIAIAPFVFEIDSEPATYELNYEVAEIHWAKIGPMLRHETRSSIDWELGGRSVEMPGFDVSGRIVWGLTLRMLNRLFSVIQPDFKPLD